MTPLALGLALMVLVMAALWLAQRRTGNAGVVDVGWSAGVGIVGVLVAVLGAGWLPRRLLVGAMIALTTSSSGCTGGRTSCSRSAPHWRGSRCSDRR